MNITLTRKEFTRLVELAYIGDWVATSMDSNSDDPAPTTYEKRYGDLMNKLYRLAATAKDGCPQYAAQDEDDAETFFPTMRLESDSPASRAIDKFTNDTFWDELITRLSDRDFMRETGREPATPPLASHLTPEELHEQTHRRISQLEDRYREEFVRNDLDNVIVLFGADKLS